MYEKTRILFDGNDRVTILTVLDQVTHNSNNPQTVIDPSTLKNAIPGFTAANFRLTFLSAQWCFDNQVSLVFLDTTPSNSKAIFTSANCGSIYVKIPNDTDVPDEGKIAYHTHNGQSHGFFIATFIKERGFDFTGKRYRKQNQPNPYLTNS
jgi:hypothetical protein